MKVTALRLTKIVRFNWDTIECSASSTSYHLTTTPKWTNTIQVDCSLKSSKRDFFQRSTQESPKGKQKQGKQKNLKLLLTIATVNIKYSPTPSQVNKSTHYRPTYLNSYLMDTTHSAFEACQKPRRISLKRQTKHENKTQLDGEFKITMINIRALSREHSRTHG